MLKLTRFDDKARDMWISPKYIVAISDTHEATYITTVNGVCAVVETPEQILAMPEMQVIAASYQPMIVPKGFTWDEYNSVVLKAG